jgi:hypothetical protein
LIITLPIICRNTASSGIAYAGKALPAAENEPRWNMGISRGVTEPHEIPFAVWKLLQTASAFTLVNPRESGTVLVTMRDGNPGSPVSLGSKSSNPTMVPLRVFQKGSQSLGLVPS